MSVASGSGISTGSSTSVSTAPDVQPEIRLTRAQCEMSTQIALKVLINSNPALTILYNTLIFADTLVTLYPEIERAYQNGGDEAVAQLLVEKVLKISINIGVTMIVSEVADQTWSAIKSEQKLETTPHQDQIAKFIINQAFNIAIAAAKEKKPLTKEFVYKQVTSAGLDYFIDSIMECKNDGNHHNEQRFPYSIFCNMSPTDHKLLREVVKETTKEIAEEYYNKWKSDRIPKLRIMRVRLTEIIEMKYSTTANKKPYTMPYGDPYESPDSYYSKNIIVTDGTSVKKLVNSTILTTNNKINKTLVEREERIKLRFGQSWDLSCEEKDLANFAAFLCRMEYLIRQPHQKYKSNTLPRKIIFYAHSKIDDEIRILMEQIAGFLLNYSSIIQIKNMPPQQTDEKEVADNPEQVDVICLFSGGLDSVAGYLETKKKFVNKKIKLVFVDHEIHKVAGVVKTLTKELDMEKDLLEATSFSGGAFLQQTRGFLFLTAAAIYAHHLKAKKIIVAECGVTKYQPNITIADEITKTTHPFMIKLAAALYRKMGIDVKIIMPFDDLTKAEIFATCKDENNILRMTHSCRNQRISHGNKHECGYCFGCLIKNISMTYISGQKQDQFFLDPLTNKRTYSPVILGRNWKLNFEKMESVTTLIGFTSAILRGNLHQTAIDTINEYEKMNLFRRFSEDMIYGLAYMKQKNILQNEDVLEKINAIEKESWFEARKIDEKRLELLRQDKMPSWS